MAEQDAPVRQARQLGHELGHAGIEFQEGVVRAHPNAGVGGLPVGVRERAALDPSCLPTWLHRGWRTHAAEGAPQPCGQRCRRTAAPCRGRAGTSTTAAMSEARLGRVTPHHHHLTGPTLTQPLAPPRSTHSTPSRRSSHAWQRPSNGRVPSPRTGSSPGLPGESH